MSNGWPECHPLYRSHWRLILLLALAVALLSSRKTSSQTASTGALTGLTLDPSGAVLPGVLLHLTPQDGSGARSATSDDSGRFGFSLLRPGTYEVQASKVDFKSVSQRDIHVHVAETLRLELHLELATRVEQTQVSSQPLMVQLDTSALGRIANQDTISGLPLATRNFAQLAGLSPGVIVGFAPGHPVSLIRLRPKFVRLPSLSRFPVTKL
jgi:hypothetical protein